MLLNHLIPESFDGTFVPGEGPTPARLMFIGEAAGEMEEYEGRPFVGRSGVRLDALLKRFLGVDRRDVYITNMVKFRPPNNRDPYKAEIVEWQEYLKAEIEAVSPEIVILLGRVALNYFYPKLRISQCHGQPFKEEGGIIGGVVVVPWYHPAAGMRTGDAYRASVTDAAEFWENLDNMGYTPEYDYRLVHEDEAVIEAMQDDEIGFDLETTAVVTDGRRSFPDIVGYSISRRSLSAVYTPTDSPNWSPALIVPELEGPRKIICHNTKFEIHRLLEHGIKLRNFEDTRGMAYLLGYSDTTLKGLSHQLLRIKPESFSETTEGVEISDPEAMRECMIQHFEYGAADADNTRRIYYILLDQLQREKLEGVYRDIELPLTPVLVSLERTGVSVDNDATEEAIKEADRVVNTYAYILEEWFPGVNLNAHQQLSLALMEMGCPLTKKTDKPGTGDPNRYYKTGKVQLQKVRKWNPKLIDCLISHGEMTKLRQFLRNFIKLQGEDGRIHPNYTQYGTLEETGDTSTNAPATGRLSSSGPNIQNIPSSRKSEWGKRVRGCLIPQRDWVWVKVDFTQQEARIISIVADDKTLQDDFNGPNDVYELVAQALYGLYSVVDVTERQRDVGKPFFLAWAFGAGWARVKQFDKTFTEETAIRGVSRLAKRYPGVAEYAKKTQALVKEFGYVETLFGRKRYMPAVYSPSAYQVEEAYRQAVNARIQGTGADVIKKMLVQVSKEYDSNRAHIIATVHDELDFEVEPGYVETLVQIVQGHAKDILPGITLPVEFEIGDSWGRLKEMEL